MRPYRADFETKQSAIAHVLLAWVVVAELLADNTENRRLVTDGTGSTLSSGALTVLVVLLGGLVGVVGFCISANAKDPKARIRAHADGVKRHWGKAAGAKYVVKAMMGPAKVPTGKLEQLGGKKAPQARGASNALALFGAKTPGKPPGGAGVLAIGNKSSGGAGAAGGKPKAAFALRDSSAHVPQALKLGV